jgi:uncharacterized protein YndB with AHSA1/START domain
MGQQKQRQIISDKLVMEKTGQPMEHWFRILDKKGAAQKDPNGIYKIISEIPGLKALGEWNQGLLGTSYQWSRGLRERGQKDKGFEIGVSKTVNAPLSVLYKALIDDKIRIKWCKEKTEFSTTTENKSARVLWSDKSTRLSIDFYDKGTGKSQIVVQHLKIADAKKAAELKEYWGKTLEALKQLLEK